MMYSAFYLHSFDQMMSMAVFENVEPFVLDMIKIDDFFYLNHVCGESPNFSHHTRTATLNAANGCFDGSIFELDVIKLPLFHKNYPFPDLSVQSVPMLIKYDVS